MTGVQTCALPIFAIEETSPTPYSMTKSYRPDGNKKAKGTKAGDNDLKEGFGAIVTARKEYTEEKRMLKLKEIEERSAAKRRRVIRLQRIYNFLLLHAILSTVLDIIGLYYPLLYYFWD